MASILILYSTVDGHTREIGERLAAVITGRGHRASLVSLDDGRVVGLQAFDRIVIGASIRYGRHRANVGTFVAQHRETLERKHGAFFSVSLVARKPTRNRVDTNPYVKRFLQAIRWEPAIVEVFAGKLDYPKYGFWDRQIIRLIMWITNGPTNPDAVVDYTDWGRVEAFANRLCETIEGG